METTPQVILKAAPRGMIRRASRPAAALALGATALLGFACSDTTAVAPVAPNVVTIHGTNFSFSAPSTVPAGWTALNFVNDGPGLHQAQLVRIDSGKTITDLRAALGISGVLPGWAVSVGGPNASDPGQPGNGIVNLRAGSYALLCVVNVPDGVPHYARGMLQAMTVTPASASAATQILPTADVIVTTDDYAFALSKPLTAGTHTFEVRNPDDQGHEMELIRLAPGKTINDMLAWLKNPSGPPPRDALGGVAIVSPASGPAYFTATLVPGNYALLCFVPDATDGKPHFMHGMVLPFSIN